MDMDNLHNRLKRVDGQIQLYIEHLIESLNYLAVKEQENRR